MLCLKKVYRDELMQLAILLSLLRVERRSYLNYDYDVPAIGVGIDDIHGWDQSHSLVRRDIQIHPKNLDSVLVNYEQQVFDDLNSLGRYNRINSLQDVTAYLLNINGENSTEESSNNSTLFDRTVEVPITVEDDTASGEPDLKFETEDSELNSYSFSGTLFGAEEFFLKDEGEYPGTSFLDSLDEEALLEKPAHGDELTEEDAELIEVLWKQDVDMGFTMEPLIPEAEPPAKPSPDPDPKADPSLSDLLEADVKLPELDEWDALNQEYLIDEETGEYVLKEDTDVTPASVDECPSSDTLLPQSDFSLEQAFELVCLDESCIDLATASAEPDTLSQPDQQESEDAVPDLDLLAEMIQTPQYHPRPFQGRMSYVRTVSMDQRWQDLAHLLNLPDPNHYHHLHHQPYQGATLPPLPDTAPYGGASNLGSAVATSMNLTNSSEPMAGGDQQSGFKMEHPHDMMYYHPNGTGEMNHTADGLLTSILDEDLQFMDMAMNEGMYTMRMLEGGAVGGVQERGADSDSAVSSMGSERVPSLSSDTEWMETNSDSGHTPADHYSTDYHGKMRWYERGWDNYARMGGDANRLSHPPSVAQKKHHMYGKRYFQDQGAVGGPSVNNSMLATSPGTPSAIKFDFGTTEGASFPALHPEVAKAAPEMKYSCSVEFSRHLHPGVRPPMEHVMHNHTYHLPPDQTQALHRPIARDKLKGRRSDEEPLTRDEKKARSMSVPIPVSEIINLPMDEFNERLSKYDLSEAQLSLIRDIRRRGKNKVAAQNCRKRKLDQIMSLADEVKQMRDRKHRLVRDRDYLVSETQRMKNKCTQLYRQIFQALRDAEGNPYSPYEWSLQQSADGSVLLVPRTNTSSSIADPDLPTKHKDPHAGRKP